MALIRRTELHGMVYDPVPMDLEDIRARARELREQAEAHANAVVEEARRERDRLIAGAAEQGHAEGFAKGHAEGLGKGREEGAAEARRDRLAELDALRDGWGAALAEFTEARDAMLERARDDVLALACAIAVKVVRRTVRLDPSCVVEQLRAVLEAHARPTRLFVRVNPDDEALAREALPELMATLTGGEHVELAADDRVPRGSCTAFTEGAGVIDARIDAQLDRIVRELLPDARASDGTPAGEDAGRDADDGGGLEDAA